MKLKHWMMESLSRARKKPKNDNSGCGNHGESTTMKPSVEKHSIKSEKAASSAASFSSSRGSGNKRLSVKEIIMPLHSSSSTGHAGHHVPRNHERKYVRDNYPAVAAYLDHQRQPLSRVENVRAFRPASMNAPPLPAMVPREREKSYRGYERLYANIGPDSIYATPAASTSSMVSSVSSSVPQNVNSPSSGSSTAAGSHPECGCYRHCQPKENGHNHDRWTSSDHCVDLCSTGSGTLNSRRVNIRTNPWIVPSGVAAEMGASFYSSPVAVAANSTFAPRQKTGVVPGKKTSCAAPPIPPPKPQRKRPPPPTATTDTMTRQSQCSVMHSHRPSHGEVTDEEEDSEMTVACSDKSVGTDGDEYLLGDESTGSSCCDCEDCCSSSCTSFTSLKFSSGPFFSTDTIQPCDSDTCSITSTPTILNHGEDDDDSESHDDEAPFEATPTATAGGGTRLKNSSSNERDSAVDSPGSLLFSRQSPPKYHHLTPSVSQSSTRSSFQSSNRRSHYSPADSHTSWKYFDDDNDEVDSGHGQTASSLGSPAGSGGSDGCYSQHISHSSSGQSSGGLMTTSTSGGSKRMYVEDNDTREEFRDIDSSIEIIRTRLQKQVYQLKHEQTALDWRMLHSMETNHQHAMELDSNDDTENMIEEDFMVQKRAILAETLDLLKRQLEEQNYRLQTSHQALQNLQLHQRRRNRDHTTALSGTKNEPEVLPRNRDSRALSTLYNQNIRETFC